MKASPPTKRKQPSAIDYLPRWTRRAVVETTGRDPLGLAAVSGTITDHLLLGITTQTSRARYYSFYAWCLWHIEKTQPAKRLADFQEHFQRRESAFALSTLLHGEGENPVGIDAARDKLNYARADGEISTAFSVLPSNSLGGYGQYYQGSLKKLGLASVAEYADIPGEGIGTQLAEAFHSSVCNTPYIQKELFKEIRVPIDDLEASSKTYNVNAIRWDAGKHERRLLVELFFELDEKTGQLNNRRWSLIQILYLLDQYEKREMDVPTEDLDDVLIYWPHYYGLLFGSNGKVTKYTTPARCETVHGLWRQYALHQFTTLALECLLRAMLDTLATHRDGLKWSDLISELLTKDFFSILKKQAGATCTRPKDLMACIGINAVPEEEVSEALQQKLTPGHMHCERSWLEIEDSTPAGWLACGIGLLAVLYGKWRGIRSDQTFKDVAKAANNELWFGSLAPVLDGWLNEDAKWEICLSDLLNRFVIERHDQVMYQKGRLDSCWINRTGDVFTKEQDIAPDVHNSRHWNAVTILNDLCLLERNDGKLRITPEGRKLLRSLLAGLTA